MSSSSDEHLFLQRALVLGCSDNEAGLCAQIALQRSWSSLQNMADFDQFVVDYLVEVSAGESWPRDLERQLEQGPNR